MLRPYLKLWDWDWIFGRAVKAMGSLGVHSPWTKPTNRSSRLSRHNHESAKAFSRSPVNFRGHGLCSLKCYDLFVATDNICAQRGTTLNYECRVQVTNFQIFSFVYHFIRLWTEILNYSTAVKFIYSAKATKFCKISTNHLTGSTYDE